MRLQTPEIRVGAWLVLLGLASVTLLPGEGNARDIIRRTVMADARNWQVARRYTGWERVDSRRLDAVGRLKSKEVTIFDVTLPDGSPYRRLAGRDDRPLPPPEDRKERDKLDRSVAARRRQPPAERAQRLAEYQQRAEWEREAWRELPDAFDFQFAGEEMVNGRSAYVIVASPHPGYRPASDTAKLFAHLRGKLWVDKAEYQLVKVEAEVVDDIWMKFFLVRVSKGSRAVFEQARVNDEVWLPLRVGAFFTARLGLLKMVYIEHEVSYSRGYEFRSVSPIALGIR